MFKNVGKIVEFIKIRISNANIRVQEGIINSKFI